MIKFTITLFLFIIFIIHNPLRSEDPDKIIAESKLLAEKKTKEEITKIKKFLENHSFNGSILAAIKDEIVLIDGFGFADINESIPNIPETQFPIGSLSEIFTSTAILKLVEQRKLNLQNPVRISLRGDDPLWEEKIPEWAKELTVHQLLTHSSGLVENLNLPTTQEIVRFLSKSPLKFKPGEKYEYCRSDYILLEVIIERLSGKSYQEFLHTDILKPLGLDFTQLYRYNLPFDNKPKPSRLALGYTINSENGEVSSAKDINPSIGFSKDTIISTVKDLYKWNLALFGGKIIGKNFVKSMLKNHLKTENCERWTGYGIYIEKEWSPTHPVYLQTSSIDGFESTIIYEPEKEISLIILSNMKGSHSFSLAKPIIKTLIQLQNYKEKIMISVEPKKNALKGQRIIRVK